MSHTPQSLEYPSPQKISVRFPVAWTVAIVAGALAINAVALVARYRFQPIFSAFKLEIPGSTKILLRSSILIVDHFGWVVVWSMAFALIGATIAVTYRRPGAISERAERWAARCIWFLIFAYILVAVFSLDGPLLGLFEAISGRP